MILQYLDLSTGHLKEDTMQLLHTAACPFVRPPDGWPAMTIAAYREGVFLSVPAEMTDEQMDALPSDLEEVLSHARDQGAALVRFDADGDALYSLPFYEW